MKTRGPLSLAPHRTATAYPAGLSSFTAPAIDSPPPIHQGKELGLSPMGLADPPTLNAEASRGTGEVRVD